MGIGGKTGGGLGLAGGVRPPVPGESGFYACRACGKRFSRKVPWFFGFGTRCPDCGSFRVVRDAAVVN